MRDDLHNIWNILLPLIPAILSILFANNLLKKHNRSRTQVSWFARWAGIIATMNTAACIAMFLICLTSNTSIESAKPRHSENLSPVSYLILSVVLLLVIFGLGWCFYRAVTATAKEEKIQHPDEVGNVD
jgi:hypothetical protein